MKELFDKLYNKSEESFYEILEKNLSQNKKTFIVTANPETFMMSEKDEEMRKLLLDNDTFLVPDGIGIVKAARMINYDVKERITGIDIANELLKLGNKQKKSIYLFGAKQEVIDSMEKVLKESYPNLNLVGMSNGYEKDKDKIFEKIVKTKPDIVLVALGIPLQEKLIYKHLDKFDKELEERGLRFVRYADDCDIFVKSEMSANRVMKSVTSWLERKLFLKVSATKTKVVRPNDSNFLGFTFWKNKDSWKCKPSSDRKVKLYTKIREVLQRKAAVARPLSYTFTKVNQIVRGWINYFRIGSMKKFMKEFGQWLRHKIRVVIIKQWKKPMRVYTNLQRINKRFKCNFTDEDIFKVANTRLGLYRQCGLNVINFIISPKVLAIQKAERPGLVNPLEYYLR